MGASTLPPPLPTSFRSPLIVKTISKQITGNGVSVLRLFTFNMVLWVDLRGIFV